MKIFDYAKSHPWTVGVLVVGGGLTFILLSGWFKGGSGSSTVVATTPSGPSEEAQLQLASIQAQAGVQSQAIQADLAKSDNENDVAKFIAGIQAQLGLAQVQSQTGVQMASIAASTQQFTIQNQTALDAAQLQYGYQTHVDDNATALAGKQIDANNTINTGLLNLLTQSNTPAPAAPVQLTADQRAIQYLQDNPDVSSSAAGGWLNSVQVTDLTGDGVIDNLDRAVFHYTNYGAGEGRSF